VGDISVASLVTNVTKAVHKVRADIADLAKKRAAEPETDEG
jgi:hypothetical protein